MPHKKISKRVSGFFIDLVNNGFIVQLGSKAVRIRLMISFKFIFFLL